MRGDRVEAVVDTGQGVQTFEIVASRAGRRIEVTTSRFMSSRLIALVEHPARERDDSRVEVTTRRRIAGGQLPR